MTDRPAHDEAEGSGMTLDRILWLARQARSGFDTLGLPEAVEGAKADLEDIIGGLEVPTPL